MAVSFFFELFFRYKHLYRVMASQDPSKENIDIGSEEARADVDVVLQDKEMKIDGPDEGEQAASVAAAENQVTKLLDELLSCDDEELDGDGAMNLLRERLNVKPHVLVKLKLPETPDIQRYDLNVLGGELTKQRSALSDVQNILKETRSKTSLKQKNSGGSIPRLGSPTPPRSPLASLSLLRRSIIQSDPLNDPFSAADVANSASTDASSMGNVELGPGLVDMVKGFDISTTSRSPSKKPIDDIMTSLGTGRDGGSEAFSCGNNVEDNGVIKQNLNLPDADVQENGPNELKDMVSQYQLLLKAMEGLDGLKPVLVLLKKVMQMLQNKLKMLAKIKVNLLQWISILRFWYIMASTGVRRSTRIRSRPLEYWKGERFLYGRIHNRWWCLVNLGLFSGNVKRKLVIIIVNSLIIKYGPEL